MARVANGSWVAGARRLLDETAGLSASERRRRLEAEHRAGRGAVQTLHRQMLAAAWLLQRASVYGVPIDDVVCAWTGVEALARLEAARPQQAERVIRDALLGRLTSREIIDLASIAPPQHRRRRDWPNAWEIFLMDEIGSLMPSGSATISQSPLAEDMSTIGKLLLVDVEWKMTDGRTVAVFLSPLLVYAQNATLVEVFKGIMTARLFYNLVAFVTFDEGERQFVEEHDASRLMDFGALVMPPDTSSELAALGIEVKGAGRE